MAKVLYKDKYRSIVEYYATVRGKRIRFTKEVLNDFSAVLPFLDDGSILLEKQYRHALGAHLLEIPAGHIEKGEKPLSAVKRELREETGYSAKNVKFMFKLHDKPAASNRVAYFYYAMGLRKTSKRRLDDTEMIRLVRVKPAELERMIRLNKITDHKTVAAYLFYKTFLQK